MNYCKKKSGFFSPISFCTSWKRSPKVWHLKNFKDLFLLYFQQIFKSLKTHTTLSLYKQKASSQPEIHLILKFNFILLIQQNDFNNCEGTLLFKVAESRIGITGIGLGQTAGLRHSNNINCGMASCTVSVGLSRAVKFGITFAFKQENTRIWISLLFVNLKKSIL